MTWYDGCNARVIDIRRKSGIVYPMKWAHNYVWYTHKSAWWGLRTDVMATQCFAVHMNVHLKEQKQCEWVHPTEDKVPCNVHGEILTEAVTNFGKAEFYQHEKTCIECLLLVTAYFVTAIAALCQRPHWILIAKNYTGNGVTLPLPSTPICQRLLFLYDIDRKYKKNVSIRLPYLSEKVSLFIHQIYRLFPE